MKAYCIFCKTGKEKIVADNINILIDGAQAIVPTKIVKEKRQGKWEDKEKSMIPRYIFVYSKQDIRELLEDRIFNIIKLLQYEDGSYELAGGTIIYEDGYVKCSLHSDGVEKDNEPLDEEAPWL